MMYVYYIKVHKVDYILVNAYWEGGIEWGKEVLNFMFNVFLYKKAKMMNYRCFSILGCT